MRAKTSEDNADDSVVELPAFSSWPIWPRRDAVEFYEHRNLQAEIDALYRGLDELSRKLLPHYANKFNPDFWACDSYGNLEPFHGAVISGEMLNSHHIFLWPTKYLFVITSDGELLLGEPKYQGVPNFHSQLAQDKTVIAAGEAIPAGKGCLLNDASGHYRPFSCDFLEKYIEKKFSPIYVMFSDEYAKNVDDLYGKRAIDFLGKLHSSMKDKVGPGLSPYINGTESFDSSVIVPWLEKSKSFFKSDSWLDALKKSVQSTTSSNDGKIVGMAPAGYLDSLSQHPLTENSFQYFQKIPEQVQPENPMQLSKLSASFASLFISEATASEIKPSRMLLENAVDVISPSEIKNSPAMAVYYCSRPLKAPIINKLQKLDRRERHVAFLVGNPQRGLVMFEFNADGLHYKTISDYRPFQKKNFLKSNWAYKLGDTTLSLDAIIALCQQWVNTHSYHWYGDNCRAFADYSLRKILLGEHGTLYDDSCIRTNKKRFQHSPCEEAEHRIARGDFNTPQCIYSSSSGEIALSPTENPATHNHAELPTSDLLKLIGCGYFRTTTFS